MRSDGDTRIRPPTLTGFPYSCAAVHASRRVHGNLVNVGCCEVSNHERADAFTHYLSAVGRALHDRLGRNARRGRFGPAMLKC